jgi:hypothetical protein
MVFGSFVSLRDAPLARCIQFPSSCIAFAARGLSTLLQDWLWPHSCFLDLMNFDTMAPLIERPYTYEKRYMGYGNGWKEERRAEVAGLVYIMVLDWIR